MSQSFILLFREKLAKVMMTALPYVSATICVIFRKVPALNARCNCSERKYTHGAAKVVWIVVGVYPPAAVNSCRNSEVVFSAHFLHCNTWQVI